MGAYAPESYEFFHYLAMLGAYAPEKWAQSLLFPLFCSLIFTIYKLFSWIYDKMVDFRRICYLLKSPDFDRKVGGHAPDYPKRQSKGKNLNYNSGNYWGLRLLTNFKEIESKNIYRIDDISFDFGPTWGIQRAYGKMHLLFDMGPVYYFDTKGNSGFFPIMLQLNLGFNAKKW